jgi:hypothetical protein
VSERVSLEERAQEYSARCNPPQQHEATEQVLLAARKYAYIYGYRAAIEDAAKVCDAEATLWEDVYTEHGKGRSAEASELAEGIRSLEDGR